MIKILFFCVAFKIVLSVAYSGMHSSLAFVNWADGALQAPGLKVSENKLGQLTGIFRDQQAWRLLDPETVVYRVWWWEPVPSGTEGGLFWGITEIQPGRVGNEYFMTRGHWHVIRNRAEFYGTVAGIGKLVLMDRGGRTWFEDMTPGSLHYVAGEVAHRIVNTGEHSNSRHCLLAERRRPRLRGRRWAWIWRSDHRGAGRSCSS